MRSNRHTHRVHPGPLDSLKRPSSGSPFDAAASIFGDLSQNEKGQISEKNQLHLDDIEQGMDTRTTLMIKNIPNKMSDRDLMEFVGRVCPRRIDFLYLRMDFQNGECELF